MKEENLKQLHSDLTLTPQNVRNEIKYHISLPTEKAYHKTHPTRVPHLMGTDSKSTEITELVQEGMTDPQEVRKALNNYVWTAFCPGD